MIEIEVEAPKEEPRELTAAEKTALLDELKSLLLPNGPYGSMSVEARNAAVDAVMSKLKGEKED
jgi:peptide subunit release factor 1 (eRF1)